MSPKNRCTETFTVLLILVGALQKRVEILISFSSHTHTLNACPVAINYTWTTTMYQFQKCNEHMSRSKYYKVGHGREQHLKTSLFLWVVGH